MLKWLCFKVWIVHELDCITSNQSLFCVVFNCTWNQISVAGVTVHPSCFSGTFGSIIRLLSVNVIWLWMLIWISGGMISDTRKAEITVHGKEPFCPPGSPHGLPWSHGWSKRRRRSSVNKMPAGESWKWGKLCAYVHTCLLLCTFNCLCSGITSVVTVHSVQQVVLLGVSLRT